VVNFYTKNTEITKAEERKLPDYNAGASVKRRRLSKTQSGGSRRRAVVNLTLGNKHERF